MKKLNITRKKLIKEYIIKEKSQFQVAKEIIGLLILLI